MRTQPLSHDSHIFDGIRGMYGDALQMLSDGQKYRLLCDLTNLLDPDDTDPVPAALYNAIGSLSDNAKLDLLIVLATQLKQQHR